MNSLDANLRIRLGTATIASVHFANAPRGVDLTGSFCTKRIDRNWLGKELCHAEEETQPGADSDAAAAD